jgi:hypothetical protein
VSKIKTLSYEQVRQKIGSNRCHLLLGNGFSIACDSIYKYGSLYDFAKKNGLTKHVQGVFDYIGTNNFEGVMRLLENGIWLAAHYGLKVSSKSKSEMSKDLESVKKALVEAIAKTHLPIPNDIGESRIKRCIDFIKPYHNIFTLNYDLLLYWVAMSESELLRRDGFRNSDNDPEAEYCVFSEHVGGDKGIFFIHGALHFYVEAGEVRKHTWKKTGIRIIKLVEDNLKHGKYPLFVAEGISEKKKIQIQANSYLSYCLGKLQRIQGPLVVFGLSLGESDQHILDAISYNNKLPEIYVGLYGNPSTDTNKEIKKRCMELVSIRRKMIENKGGNELEVNYFNAESANVWG